MKLARGFAALSPAAFAQTKAQIRKGVLELLALNGTETDQAVTALWTAPETLARVKDYVAKTLTKH